MKEAAHDVLVRAGSQVCSVVVFVATVAPGVASRVEGEAGGGRRPGLGALSIRSAWPQTPPSGRGRRRHLGVERPVGA